MEGYDLEVWVQPNPTLPQKERDRIAREVRRLVLDAVEGMPGIERLEARLIRREPVLSLV